MAQSTSAYLKAAGDVRSIKQLHAVATAICEDPRSSSYAKLTSTALIRKLNQIIHLPIAKAAFLASIWRDFQKLRALLERDHDQRTRSHSRGGASPIAGAAVPARKKGQRSTAALEV
jgi:hypothetical protein